MKFFTKKQFLTVFIEYPNTGNNLNVCQQLNKPIVVYLYNGLLHNNDSKSAAAPWEITIRKINQAQRNISLPKNLCDVYAHVFSCVWLSSTPQTIALQVPLSMGFSMQEYYSGLPFPPPEVLSHLGMELHLGIGRQILYY